MTPPVISDQKKVYAAEEKVTFARPCDILFQAPRALPESTFHLVTIADTVENKSE